MKYEVASDKSGTAGYDNVNKKDLHGILSFQEIVILANLTAFIVIPKTVIVILGIPVDISHFFHSLLNTNKHPCTSQKLFITAELPKLYSVSPCKTKARLETHIIKA